MVPLLHGLSLAAAHVWKGIGPIRRKKIWDNGILKCIQMSWRDQIIYYVLREELAYRFINHGVNNT